MADSWEDWETEEAAVPLPPGAAAPAAQPVKKFEDEDEDEEEPKWKGNVPAPQQAKDKKGLSKYDESKGAQRRPTDDDEPLDNPIAEKLRQQRLIEEADYQATMELFGSSRELEGFIPKSHKDYEEYGKLVAAKYLAPHTKSSNFKSALKTLLRTAMQTMPAGEVKDIETCVAGIRSDRLRDEKAAAASGKKTQQKAKLNLGRGGGAAGLDDYIYADAGDGDDFDFM
ncbi:Eukaryotic translation initiation factor 3 subunit J [Micractinium conductrix]|uniref:Eukaryotic translation initiation factor 3 subunit J n=1 Tax=Micractinium conductrix TaxID=554055 RepID=A0A2P6VGS8_9CHLO|nr:Eukaryotic translation initiation factor 3 subunit J [Micractinium conductrix]|eukprot:PSC73295.1 Eukaryotic translation initiation factor 3 subunit J [Micractinium conductrix]